MKIAAFSTKPYDLEFLSEANQPHAFEWVFHEVRLSRDTAILAKGCAAVCVFVNDDLGRDVISKLAQFGVRCIALRCAGFNNVDLKAAQVHGIPVVRVPAYSPHAVAEHAVALILSLNRKTHRAHNRVREGNFALEGLLGFDLNGLTVGVVGTGRIGQVFATIMLGFGCKILAYDPFPDPDFERKDCRYGSLPELYASADILSLHCPLTPETDHLIDAEAIARMKHGVMLINTSRGALVDTRALIEGLKSGIIGNVGLDVYEEEADLFFEDLSDKVIQDDVFARLMTFPNVMITGHQAFFTKNALRNIAETTLSNIAEVEISGASANQVHPEKIILS